MHRMRMTALAAGIALMTLGGCSGVRTIGQIQVEAAQAETEGRYLDAAGLYQEWIERRPASPEANYRLGRALLSAGDAPIAREYLTIASDLKPRNTAYRDGLIEAMSATGELDEVFALLERRAAEQDGPEAYIRLGTELYANGLSDDAERAFLLAAQTGDEDWPDGQRALARFYRDLGRKPEEIERLRVLYYLDPEDAGVRERLTELGEILGPTAGIPPSALHD